MEHLPIAPLSGTPLGTHSLSKMPDQRKTVLVLEDEALIALDLEMALREAGYRVGGPFGTCEGARIWLRATKPDVALLDAFVGDGPTIGLARDLKMRGVPIVIFSGRDAPDLTAPEMPDAIWVTKPAPMHDVVAAVNTAHARRSNVA